MRKIFVAILLSAPLFLFSQTYKPVVDSITMRDGKKIAADIYISDSSQQLPVILVQTPYNRLYYRFNLPLVGQNLAGCGYNFVITDWRGFYGSTAAYVAGYNRGLDGYDIIEWISQQTFSNGKVGTYGASALGKIQFETAKEQPPHLVCCVPLVANPQMTYLEYFPGGVYRTEYVQQLDNLGFGLSSWLLNHPYFDFQWQYVENNTFYPDLINVPVFMIGGWYDHTINQMLDFFNALRQQSPVATKHKLLMGPWVHGGHSISYVGSCQQGELTFDNACNWNDSLSLRFFDYYLKNINNNWENEPVFRYYQIGDNIWKSANDVTAVTTNEIKYYLSTNHSLDMNMPVEFIQSDSIVYNPADPSPTYGGPTLRSDLLQGPYDQSQMVESRNDILIFTTSALQKPVSILGKIKVTLFVGSKCKDTDFAIRICDVYPDGRSMLINDGIKRMRFINGYKTTDTAFMRIDSIYQIMVELPYTAYTFLTGHRIRVDITSSNYPRFDKNLNNGGEMYNAGDIIIATNYIYYEQLHASYVSLPVLTTDNINLYKENTPFTIYPNPVNTYFKIINVDKIKAIELYDIIGNEYPIKLQEYVNISNLKSGIYIIKILTNENKIFLDKIIKL